ncbi:MAG: glycosyltransferase [Actinobacteria bacterium]|nr:glycosyltransferase [Actinomycetota bacterium]
MARVLHVVGDSKFGGASVLIGRLAQAAQAQKYEVDVLTTNKTFAQHLRNEGVGVVDLDVARRAIRPARDLSDVRKLKSFLNSRKYTVVHTHTSKGGLVGRLAAWSAHVPVVVHTVHGFAIHEGSSLAATRAYASLETIAATRCHRVVTVSEFHRDWAIRLGIAAADKIVAIPNGIDPRRVAYPGTKAEARSELGLNQATPLVVNAGRLAPQKGLSDLLAAMTEVNARTGARLILAGDGPMREQLEEEARALGISEAVDFLGFRSDVGRLLRASDVVVLPSIREGLSIALLEAMAAGKPIVATAIGSNIEVTGDGTCADLVEVNAIGQIAEATVGLLRDAERAEELGALALARFNSSYQEETMLRAYMELYREPYDFRLH